jgi:hypothetical protein
LSGAELLQKQLSRYNEDLKVSRQSHAEINSATFKKTKKSSFSSGGGGKPSLLSIFSQIDEDFKSAVTKSDETFEAKTTVNEVGHNDEFLSSSHGLSNNNGNILLRGKKLLATYYTFFLMYINVLYIDVILKIQCLYFFAPFSLL